MAPIAKNLQSKGGVLFFSGCPGDQACHLTPKNTTYAQEDTLFLLCEWLCIQPEIELTNSGPAKAPYVLPDKS